MHLVFACPGMPFRGDTLLSRSLGGSESACYYIAKGMAALGHKVLVFTTQEDAEGEWDGVRYAWCGPASQHAPLGEYCHIFIESTYHDALILQRATGVLRTPLSAKTSFLWLHDLALIRQIPPLRQDLYQYDGILAVSEWHRSQIADVWEADPKHITVIRNSVDRALYDVEPKAFTGKLKMLYQSRPERGIDYLVAPGGIMERLAKARPGAHLYVAGYDNQPDHMQGYYSQVYARVDELPNCTRLPYMDKATLAATQKGMDLLVYAGEFEETSCITAMEAQAAGLPFLASSTGAQPETCEGAGAKLVPLIDGKCDTEAFYNYLTGVDDRELKRLKGLQLAKAEGLDWGESAKVLDQLITDTIRHKQRNRFSMMRTMIDRSDVMLLKRYVNGDDTPEVQEFDQKYAFIDHGHEGLLAQYDSAEAVSELDKDANLDMSGNRRFMEVANQLLQSDPAHVLDYGCQKGHYIWTLAALRPQIQYVGVDISPRIIEWAEKHAKVDRVSMSYKCGDVLAPDFRYDEFGKFDGLILGEVLEHVPNPLELCYRLEPLLTDGARVVISTPFGDWEGKDYLSRPDAPRYHLHHFERADLNEMFGHNEGYLTTCVPAGRSNREPLGSWITTFVYREGMDLARPIDWERKLAQFVPRETVSFCALARNSESTILRSLLSVRDIADEYIIALDKSTTDNTRDVLERFRDMHCRHRRFVILDAESPLEIGFDAARNLTIDHARGDWILWMDNDEDLIYPERLVKYLRHNQYDGYAVPQNHMSADPVGILTTDYPVRVFRRVPYLKFNGVVHEHPDDVENQNGGPRHPAMLGETHILHHGYTTEAVRRERFYRNLPLIKRDRKENPNRLLGKLLWMRDLSHMCMFGAEQTNGYVTDDMRKYAEEGIAIFEGMLKEAEEKPIAARMLRDGIEYYSNLVSVLGEGFETEFQLHCAKQFGQAKLEHGPRRKGRFKNREHFERYMKFCYDEQMQGFEKRYW